MRKRHLEKFIKHVECEFASNSGRYIKSYGTIDINRQEIFVSSETENEVSISEARTARNVSQGKRHCFICDCKRDSDDSRYNEGGLGRCSVLSANKRLIERKVIYMKDPSHRFCQAAKRLDILLSGPSHDIFALDVFYDQSCYIKFALAPLHVDDDELNKERKQDVLQAFYYQVRTSIVRDKNAFLLNELLEDIKILSDEQGLPFPAIEHTATLKQKLIQEFEERISFFPSGKYLLVHASDVNPCEYAIAALHGSGLRDDDLARSFGRMVRRKLQKSADHQKQWPLTPEELTEMLDRGPLQDLYNVIYYTITQQL